MAKIKKVENKEKSKEELRIEYYKKRIEELKKLRKKDRENTYKEMKNLRDLHEEQYCKMEMELIRLNQLIGILKTGRIRYENTIEVPVSENFPKGWAGQHPIDKGAIEKVSGVIFLQEIQQVEVRPDHVLIVTNSGREICLGKAYDYLENIFSVK